MGDGGVGVKGYHLGKFVNNFPATKYLVAFDTSRYGMFVVCLLQVLNFF